MRESIFYDNSNKKKKKNFEEKLRKQRLKEEKFREKTQKRE